MDDAKKNENNIQEGTNSPKRSKHTIDLQTLLDHQSQVQQWLQMVNNKIFEMETTYLEECVSGNVIKGWDLDGRTLPLHRSRNSIEEKDRLFSFSSHNFWLEKRNNLDSNSMDKAVAQTTLLRNNSVRSRKQRKRKSDFDDWNGPEDY